MNDGGVDWEGGWPVPRESLLWLPGLTHVGLFSSSSFHSHFIWILGVCQGQDLVDSSSNVHHVGLF